RRAVRGDPSSPACWPLSVHLGAYDCHSIGPRGWSMTEELRLCSSAKMQAIRDLIAKVAALDITVLLQGESGVGKEVVARAIHLASPRAHRQFLQVNCAALPDELLESELFGHEKGAFTGAYRQKPGKFEAVDRGTLLFDEIGEIPLELQAKLLHVLQDGGLSRVGGENLIRGGPRPAVTPSAVTATVNPEQMISLKEIARRAARDAECVAINEVLDRVHWNRAKAARLLQIDSKTLQYKIEQCGLGTREEKQGTVAEPAIEEQKKSGRDGRMN